MKIAIAPLALGLALMTVTFSRAVAADPPAAESQEDFRKQLSELQWIRGPQKVQLFGNSALDLPAGFVFLNPAETAKLETMTHNIGGGTEYFLAPDNLQWGAHFTFKDDGYVKDDEKIDAPALLQSIKDGTLQANQIRRDRGWDEMEVVGWQTEPHYDTQTNRLEWAVVGRDLKTATEVVNFNTRILGRGGVMSVVLITGPHNLTAATDEFNTTLAGFAFDPGQRYAEYKPGDKVAKYGLAALITGGAARRRPFKSIVVRIRTACLGGDVLSV
jgi:uncharacterized membrane-anchored protein